MLAALLLVFVTDFCGMTPQLPPATIHCPYGHTMDPTCVEIAEQTYLSAIGGAMSQACFVQRQIEAEYNAHIDDMLDDLAYCLSSMHQVHCVDEFNAKKAVLDNWYYESMGNLEDSFEAAAEDIEDQYWSDLASCCQSY